MRRYLVIIIPFLCTSSLFWAMEPAEPPTVTTAVFLLHDNKILHTTNYNCRIINPDSSTVILYDKPVHKAIMDDAKQRVGLVGDNYFLVYDLNGKEFWRHYISHYEDYSAAFSRVDDTIFLRQGNNLICSNNSLPRLLMCPEPNKIFNITPHPTKNAIFYPSFYNSLALLLLDNNQITYPLGKFIKSAVYSNCGNYAVVHTHQNKIYLQNIITNKIDQLICGCVYCQRNPIHKPVPLCIKVLPQLSIVLILYEHDNLYLFKFFDLITPKYIYSWFTKYLEVRNVPCLIDFSPDGTLCAAKTSALQILPTPPIITEILGKNKTCFAYLILKKYSEQSNNIVPQDIIYLLMKILFALYDPLYSEKACNNLLLLMERTNTK